MAKLFEDVVGSGCGSIGDFVWLETMGWNGAFDFQTNPYFTYDIYLYTHTHTHKYVILCIYIHISLDVIMYDIYIYVDVIMFSKKVEVFFQGNT